MLPRTTSIWQPDSQPNASGESGAVQSIIQRLIDDKITEPVSRVDEVYRSSNDDLWQLVRKASPKRCLVRHVSNPSAGGAVSEISVEEFLAINGSGPEHGALRLLLAETEAVT